MFKKRIIACVSLGLLSASAVVLGIACTSESDTALFPSAESTCQLTYGAGCGSACVIDGDCASGLFCKSTSCTADCVPGKLECSDGSSCGADGRCASSPKNTMFGEGNEDAAVVGDGGLNIDPDASCADINVSFDKTQPTVILLVDQSGSMTTLTADNVQRWAAVKTALMNPDGGVVKSLESDVRFGLALYQWKSGDSTCPMIVKTTPVFGGYSQISSTYNANDPKDNTPTGESILSVAGLNDSGVPQAGGFALSDAGGPKIIVLATDGDPDTCAAPNSNGTDPPKQLSIYATQKAFNAGIRTFVVAVGNDVSEAHQRQVANAGAGLPVTAVGDAGARYYRANDTASLVGAFREIVTGQRSCKFTLRGEVVAGTEDLGRVTLNGTQLTRNATDGWRLNGRNEVELLGASCTTVKTAPEADLRVRFPCGSVVNIPSGPR